MVKINFETNDLYIKKVNISQILQKIVKILKLFRKFAKILQ